MHNELTEYSLNISGWPGTQRDLPVSPLNAGIKGVHYHAQMHLKTNGRLESYREQGKESIENTGFLWQIWLNLKVLIYS